MPGKTILLIDDDAHIRKMASVRLESEGYRVLTASRGDDGLTLVKKHHPDLILLDLVMPGLDGREVVRALREDATTKDIPVILLTVVEPSEDSTAASNVNLDGLMRQLKPYKPAELLAKIRTLLS